MRHSGRTGTLITNQSKSVPTTSCADWKITNTGDSLFECATRAFHPPNSPNNQTACSQYQHVRRGARIVEAFLHAVLLEQACPLLRWAFSETPFTMRIAMRKAWE
jgi:hypothetical protein